MASELIDIDSEPSRARGIIVNQPGRRYVICKPAMQFVILQIFWVSRVDPFLLCMGPVESHDFKDRWGEKYIHCILSSPTKDGVNSVIAI